MNNCVKLREGFNEGVDWMLPQFQEIKDISVAFTINKMLQCCVGKVGVFKRSATIGSSIICGFGDDMVLNPILDVLSSITRGGCNFQGENSILLYLNVIKIFCIQEGYCRDNVV